MKRVLMVAFHFPPLAGGSGIQRSLRFVQHLPQLGWQPLVLAPSALAYAETGDDLLAEIPADVLVHRAFALDTARHLAWKGRYLGCMARPDRWVSWKFAAIRAGMRLIEHYRPDVLWSTYPIATAHLIGAALQRRSGIPWVADFRDPMAQDGYPADPAVWRSFERIESDAFGLAARCVLTTPGAASAYRQRYPQAAERIAVIENGYDEESFAGSAEVVAAPLRPGCITLLHSGIVYPSERDPRPLFQALRALCERGDLRRGEFCLRFRAPVHDRLLQQMAAEYALADFIEVLPAISYREALLEMRRADALLLLQASNCNAQIPAKFYEYLRAGPPILALTDPAGDTAGALRAVGVEAIVELESSQKIMDYLPGFLQALRSGDAPRALPQAVRAASRRERSVQLAALFDKVVAEKV